MPTRARHLVLLGTAAIAVTACATNPNPVPLTPTQQFTVEVRERAQEVALAPSPAGLSRRQGEELQHLAGQWRDGGGEPVVVRVPEGAPQDVVEPTVRAAVDTLVGAGVTSDSIRFERYNAGPRGGPVVVGFNRVEAIGPDCSSTWGPVDSFSDSRTTSNFGCSVTANIAAQVANPRDLIRPRQETPADAARRQAQMAQYRAGQPTGAQRGPDEQSSLRNQVRQ